jgi:hypothetical protein
MKFDVPIPFVQSKYRPTEAELQAAFDAGYSLAEKVMEKISNFDQ